MRSTLLFISMFFLILVMFSCPQTREPVEIPSPLLTPTSNAYPFINGCFKNCIQFYGSVEDGVTHCRERCIQNGYRLDDDDIEKIKEFDACCQTCENYEWGTELHKTCYNKCLKEYLEN